MAASRSPLMRKANDLGARATAFYDERRPRRRTGRRAVASESALHVLGDGFLWVMASTNKALAATADQDADPATRSADMIRIIFPAPSAIRFGEISP
jgi:hypothetical protein